jgi:hypothetical protein
MNEKEIKNLITEISTQIYNSVLKGNSGFAPQIDKRISILETHFVDIKETLSRIEAQTLKTNGRTGALENWRSYIVGGLSIMGLVLILIAYIWNTNMNEVKTKQTNLTQGLNEHIKTTNQLK